MNEARRLAGALSICGQGSGGLTDVPFYGVQPIAAVRDVRGSDVLAGGEEIFHTDGEQSAERDLKGDGTDVDVVCPAGGWMKIDAITANPD